MINNEKLSRLNINFKTVINHPLPQLRVSKTGFLHTSQREQIPDVKTMACVQDTYEQINTLLHYSPEKLQASDLDFQLYVSLIHQVISWSTSSENPSGFDCIEKAKLLTSLNDFDNFLHEIEEQEKITAENIIHPSSSEELFALTQEQQENANILIILTDEEKKLIGYEGKEVKEFHDRVLVGKNEIKENGIECIGHHTASNACSPSRAALASGHYLSLTDVKHTDGVTMAADDPKIKELSPQIPTYGSYFKKAGYDTKIVGKVHFTHRDLLSVNAQGKLQAKASKAANQEPDGQVVQEYLEADLLAEYDLNGWVGPDPHGSSQNNTAFNRDPDYVKQITDWLKARDEAGNNKPFLAVVSLVNPHDIVYFPFAWLYFVYKYGFPLPGQGVNSISVQLPPSMGDGLEDRPLAQSEYRKQYGQMFSGNFVNGTYNGPLKEYNPFNIYYQKTYLFFQQLVDKQVQTIYHSLKQTAFYHNTYVVLSTDHGELLGAHGLAQKWLVTDKEAIDIPLIISHPNLVHKGKQFAGFTSHVDLLPTLLKLAGLDKDVLTEKLKTTHTEVHPLVGTVIGDKPLASSLDSDEVQILDRALFVTADNPFNGEDKRSILAQLYNFPQFMVKKIEGINENTFIEMVEARLMINGKMGHYKYASYTQDPSEIRRSKSPRLEELFYDLEIDLYERFNLAKQARLSFRDQQAFPLMKALLEEERERKLIRPYDPEFLTRPQRHQPHVARERPDYDFLFLLLTPPALILLSVALLAYYFPEVVLTAGAALTTLGLFNKIKKSQNRVEDLIEQDRQIVLQ